MHYDSHRQHSHPLASCGAALVSCDIDGGRECLLDMETTRPVRPEGETRRVMDQLLRECLKRKPLS